MRQRAFVLSLLALCVAQVTFPVKAAPQEVPPNSGSVETVAHLWGHLQALQKMGPRPGGSDAALEAGQYFQRQMKSLGYDVWRQMFSVSNGFTGANWIADQPGDSGTFLMVAAHLDTVPGSPGVNDDASGVAALIELARKIHNLKLRKGVRFAAFGAEEDLLDYGHHYSAQKYLEGLPLAERSRIEGVIYLDKVGRGDSLSIGRALQRDPSMTDRLQPVAFKLLGQPKSVKTLWRIGLSPFGKYMIPVAWVEWTPSPDTHTPRDVVDKIQVQRILQTIDVVRNFLTDEKLP